MPRPMIRDIVIGKDVASAIRRYSFGNILEFYRRYRHDLGMSRATFYRVMSFENTTMENILSVELVARKMGIANEGGTSNYGVKVDCIEAIMNAIEKFLKDPSVKNQENLHKVYSRHRLIILSKDPY